jgi:hypothetical protein
VCVRERERESVSVCVYVCVCELMCEREIMREREINVCACILGVCMHACKCWCALTHLPHSQQQSAYGCRRPVLLKSLNPLPWGFVLNFFPLLKTRSHPLQKCQTFIVPSMCTPAALPVLGRNLPAPNRLLICLEDGSGSTE